MSKSSSGQRAATAWHSLVPSKVEKASSTSIASCGNAPASSAIFHSDSSTDSTSAWSTGTRPSSPMKPLASPTWWWQSKTSKPWVAAFIGLAARSPLHGVACAAAGSSSR